VTLWQCVCEGEYVMLGVCVFECECARVCRFMSLTLGDSVGVYAGVRVCVCGCVCVRA